MLTSFNERFSHDQRVSLLFAAGAVVAGILAVVFGFPGEYLGGILLAYLSSGLLIMALVHSWRAPRKFVMLALVSFGAFVVFAVLHNLAYAVAELTHSMPIVSGLFSILEVLFFLLAVLLAPAGVGIGIVGALVTWLLHRKPA